MDGQAKMRVQIVGEPPHLFRLDSFREKKMLERARYLLVSEIAISRNCEEGLIEQALTKALTKCNLRFPEISELAS